ncbi:MAG: transglycosylase SLT domain-containing protein [Rhodospirillales bacterium]|nr:transglycosylase SLT domain-containing protein [Rhodospirillales bacterium]
MVKRAPTMGLLAFISVTAALATLPGPASLHAKQVIDYKKNSCHAATEQVERAESIPRHLLTAISLAETGRWSKERGEVFAWPWTVTAKGNGVFYPSKAEAITAVEDLKEAGVKNIDVGCMQINLQYHPRAFTDLETAFDPSANINYAAKFLKGIQEHTKSWPQAAANYHSTDPLRNASYKDKVLALWGKIDGRSLGELGPLTSPDPAYAKPETPIAQAQLLDSRFRAKLIAERNAAKPEKALDQLNTWRSESLGPNYRNHMAALQKAKRAQRQRLSLTKGKVSFADKRLAQLQSWRRDRRTNPFGTKSTRGSYKNKKK